MTALALLFVTIFFAASYLGWRYCSSFFWHYVDVIYYPLAAIGVILLFLSNDVQRELLDVTVLANQQSEALVEMKSQKPTVAVLNTDSLLSANLDHLALITKWAEICQGGPSNADARCLAVKDIGPLVSKFLLVAKGDYPTYEERLLTVCTAGDQLLENIRTSQAISPLVMDKFLEHYTRTTSKQLSPLAFLKIVEEANQFSVETLRYAEQIHRIAFKEDDAGGRLLLDVQKAEISYGEMLFLGLSQCITAPRRELGSLQTWSATTKTKEEAVASLEGRRRQLKESATRHTTALWLQLNLWPFALVVALSLKFAKGVATLRKAVHHAE
jgi:hypothetical protein